MNPTETLTAAPTWDLDTIFSGETESKEYAKFRADVRDDLKKYEDEIKSLPGKLDNSNLAKWSEFINRLQALTGRIYDAESFAHCLISRDVKDEKAGQIVGEIDVYNAALKRIMVLLEAFAKEQEDSMWQKLVNSGELKEGSYFLDELRRMAKIKMAPEYETLAAELAVNGYHAWNRLYDKIYGELSAEFKENGNVSNLSLGQLANKMSNPNRDIRRQSFEKLEAAWESRGGEATMILNYMAGFRLSLYKKRKWDSILTEPLFESRIKNETLDAMWDAVNKSAPQMKRYIAAKKKLLGIDNFRWYDQTAPVGASDKQYSFVEACDFIIDKLGAFNKKQGEFTQMAINNRWVEAENRPGKAGGAFCTSFIGKKQSRVLMTYESSFDNLLTLAHELGHAYHQQLLKDEPVFAMSYPMTLAETASIFNELLVTDAALSSASEQNEKLMLLDQKLQNAYVLFCNLYARYLFEKAFYKERANGLVSRARLDELMVTAQKKSYMGTLADDGYHKLFWASKLHFFFTDVPFYNFPYTFGFLFASGVYDRAKKEGASFAENYRALLMDTGKMSSEDVARKHMNVDLTKEDFWSEAVNRIMSDVDEFEKLVG